LCWARSIPAAVVAARKTDFSLKNAVDDLSISVYDKTNTKEPTIREREDEGDVEVGAKGARSIADWGTFTNSEGLNEATIADVRDGLFGGLAVGTSFV
jgi:hypothetical protein